MLEIFKKIFGSGNDTQLKESIAAGALLVDVRSEGEFASGHIEGSVNIPVDSITARVQVLKKDKPIVVYCKSGARSMAAKAILEKKGFSNIVNGGSINNVSKLITTK